LDFDLGGRRREGRKMQLPPNRGLGGPLRASHVNKI